MELSELLRHVAAVMEGRGGGKAHLAQGGGDIAKLDEALEAVQEIVRLLIAKGT